MRCLALETSSNVHSCGSWLHDLPIWLVFAIAAVLPWWRAVLAQLQKVRIIPPAMFSLFNSKRLAPEAYPAKEHDPS